MLFRTDIQSLRVSAELLPVTCKCMRSGNLQEGALVQFKSNAKIVSDEDYMTVSSLCHTTVNKTFVKAKERHIH